VTALIQRRRSIAARTVFWAVALSFLQCPAQAQQTDAEIFISAASDLQFTLPELVKVYNKPTLKIQLRFGASATLATQAIRGLQTDIFLSADAAQVNAIKQAGLGASEPFTYAIGHLAVAIPSSAPNNLKLDSNLASVRIFFDNEVSAGKRPKFAIANPAHAPYGIAASQAIETFRHAEFFKPHLVLAENVAQAAQYIASGAVTAGIISASLCKSQALSTRLRCQDIDKNSYQTILQSAIQIKSNSKHSKEASEFLQFLQSEKAKAVLLQYGFGLPQ
jgi:molybdate transport system substrate-binding protein